VSADARRGREQRLISRCRVELDHRSGASDGETEDVSLSGLYVRTDAILPVGDETDLRLHLPDGSIVALYARIAHVLTPDAARAVGRHAGIGLELIGPDTPARAKLIEHLDSLPRPAVDGLRFSLALRGYRMDEVDDVLDRLVDELDRRGERISELEARLTEED